MKKLALVIAAVALVSFTVVGCAKKAANSEEAIQQSKNLKSVDEQVNYLVSQGNAFVNSKEFDEAIQTAKYILSDLDKNSAAAQEIITKAKEEMEKAAKNAMEDMKNKMGSMGQ